MAAFLKNARPKFGVYLCLLATVLLQAPLAAAAWNLSSMSCCNGDYCPLHGHHHQKRQTQEMDCQHESDEMTACSMNCCPTPEKAALTPLTFVLPCSTVSARESVTTSAVDIPQPNELCSIREPLAPPPRFTAVVL
jgi:hypothetical protein